MSQWQWYEPKGQEYFNKIAKCWSTIEEVYEIENGLLLDGYYANDFKGFY